MTTSLVRSTAALLTVITVGCAAQLSTRVLSGDPSRGDGPSVNESGDAHVSAGDDSDVDASRRVEVRDQSTTAGGDANDTITMRLLAVGLVAACVLAYISSDKFARVAENGVRAVVKVAARAAKFGKR